MNFVQEKVIRYFNAMNRGRTCKRWWFFWNKLIGITVHKSVSEGEENNF